MRLLFLDIDGVCNSVQWFKATREDNRLREGHLEEHLDPKAVGRVKGIVEDTGVKVALSSSWRRLLPLPAIIEAFQNNGWPEAEFLGVTPLLASGRGAEIALWIANWRRDNELVAAIDGLRYCILDDDVYDMRPEQLPHLVAVDARAGLTDADADRARRILNGETRR